MLPTFRSQDFVSSLSALGKSMIIGSLLTLNVSKTEGRDYLLKLRSII